MCDVIMPDLAVALNKFPSKLCELFLKDEPLLEVRNSSPFSEDLFFIMPSILESIFFLILFPPNFFLFIAFLYYKSFYACISEYSCAIYKFLRLVSLLCSPKPDITYSSVLKIISLRVDH